MATLAKLYLATRVFVKFFKFDFFKKLPTKILYIFYYFNIKKIYVPIISHVTSHIVCVCIPDSKMT